MNSKKKPLYLFDKLERDCAVQILTLDLMLTKTSNQWKSFATKSMGWLRNHFIWSIEQNDNKKANIFCLSALKQNQLSLLFFPPKWDSKFF